VVSKTTRITGRRAYDPYFGSSVPLPLLAHRANDILLILDASLCAFASP